MKSAIFDLSKRAKFRVIGADRLRYLNGQMSNDVRKAKEDFAIHACVLSVKGKIDADIFLVAESDSFLIDCDAALREILPARLERYIIADDVQIEEVTDNFSMLHVIGTEVPANLRATKTARANRFGMEGTDVWFSRAPFERDELFCDEAGAEVFRIERGVPVWGSELTDQIIPLEANLEASAIDYGKGCYIGQEVISRMKMSGQTNKRLCGLISDFLLQPGTRLTSSDGKDAGWITSAAWSAALQKNIALAFVKRGWNEAGTILREGCVAALPFV